jgi:hypothetical protein
MSEQQVRLSDKQAMVCVKITKFSTFIGEIEVPLGCCEREKKVKSLLYAKTTKKVKRLNYSHKNVF